MRHLFVALTLLTLSATGRADFLSGATGFSTLQNPQTGQKIPGMIHFAVLNRSGGGYGDTWGTRLENFDMRFARGVDAGAQLSPGIDYSARYLYLYQLTNEGPEVPFESLAVRLLIHPSRITSWGSFRDTGFADRKPGSATWTEVSARNPFGMMDPHAAGGSGHFVVYYPRVVDIIGGLDPLVNPREVLLGSNAVRASWVGGELVAPGRRSSIFGFTSNHPPTLAQGSVVQQCGKAGQPPCPPPL